MGEQDTEDRIESGSFQNTISPEIRRVVASQVQANDRNDHLLLSPETDEVGPYEPPYPREGSGLETYVPAYLNVPHLRRLALLHRGPSSSFRLVDVDCAFCYPLYIMYFFLRIISREFLEDRKGDSFKMETTKRTMDGSRTYQIRTFIRLTVNRSA